MNTNITFKLKTFLTTTVIFIAFSSIAQTGTGCIENNYGVPNTTWGLYSEKTNDLLKQIDVESFFNYIILTNDGNTTDIPYFKNYIRYQIIKDYNELVYRVGKGTIFNKQQLSIYLSSLQPNYIDLFKEFQKNHDEIIQVQTAENNNQNTRRLNTNPTPQNCGAPCNNPGFESGNTFWDFWAGNPDTAPDPSNLTSGFNPPTSGLHPIQHLITAAGGFDPIVGGTILPVVPPGGGNNALQLGDAVAWGNPSLAYSWGAARASISFTVSAANSNFTYRYAVVLNDPGTGSSHGDINGFTQRPYFRVKLRDQLGNPVTCGYYEVVADASQPNFSSVFTETHSGSDVWYRPWTTVFVPLQAYIGQCVTVEFTTSDCTQGGHFGYGYVDCSCEPLSIISSSPNICGGHSVTLTAPAGGVSYTWSDSLTGGAVGIVGSSTGPIITVNQGGTYKVVITSVAGPTCQTTLYITIGSNPSYPISQFTSTTVCAGAPTQFTDTSTPVGSINGWKWDFDHDGIADDTTQNPSHIFPAVGTYPVTLRISWGACNADTTLNANVIAGVTPVLTPAGPFCANASPVNLTASITGGTWTGPGITNSSLGTFSPAPANIGSDTVKYSVSGNCPASASEVIVVKALPVSDAGANVTLCTGSSAVIGAPSVAGYAYSWTPSTALSSASASNPTVTLTNPGTLPLSTLYTVTTTEAGTSNCQSTDTVRVTVNTGPTANAGSTQTVCQGTALTLSGAIGGTATSGTWTGGTGTYNPNNTTLDAVYTPSAAEYAAGSVQLTLTTDDPPGPCTFSSSNVTFHFYEIPVVNFSGDVPSGCPVHCVNFTDASAIGGGDAIVTWDWDFGDGSPASNQSSPSHCYSQSGYYDVKLTLTSNHGCTAFLNKTQMVHVFDLPTAQFDPTPNPASILDPTITFQNQSSSDVSYWFWDFGDSTNLAPTTSSPIHIYPQNVSSHYLVTLVVHNSDGCYDTVAHPIFIGPEFAFFIPNAFTPNGDGINDYFYGSGVGITQYDLWIFDRWGDMVFHGKNLDDKWNGKANNGSETAQMDVYIWKVRLTDVFNNVHDYIGTVTIAK